MPLLATPQLEALSQRLRQRPASCRRPACEPVQTTRLAKSSSVGRLAGLARLWAVPRVALEAVQDAADAYHQRVCHAVDAVSDSDESVPFSVGSPCSAEDALLDDSDGNVPAHLTLKGLTRSVGHHPAEQPLNANPHGKGTVDWVQFYSDVIASETPHDRLYSPHAPESRLYRILQCLDLSRDSSNLLGPSFALDDETKRRGRYRSESASVCAVRCSCSTCSEYNASRSVHSSGLRNCSLFPTGVSTLVAADIIRRTLMERQSPLFSKNMSVAIAVVLFHLDSDKHVSRYAQLTLRNAGLCAALRRYEHSNEFSGCLASLEPSKFVPLLRDLSDVVEDSENREGVGYGISGCAIAISASEDQDIYKEHADGQGGTCSGAIISKGAIIRYCEKRELLTRRAVHALFARHGSRVRITGKGGRCASSSDLSSLSSRPGDWSALSNSECGSNNSSASSLCGSFTSAEHNLCVSSDSTALSLQSACSLTHDTVVHKQSAVDVLSGLDFVRLYMALVKCGTNIGVRYWFRVMDIDGDEIIDVQDAKHFYSERRREGELRAQGSILCNLESIWTRICASAGGSDGTCSSLGLREVLRMAQSDREFMLCALLISRIDDTQLVDVAATERRRAAATASTVMDVDSTIATSMPEAS